MRRQCPQLSPAFTETVARGDLGVESAIRNMNKAVRVFHDTYAARDVSLPVWSHLSGVGGTTTDHVLLDLSYLVNALGRRLADLFFDLVDSLERRRLAVSALSARAVIETCAAIVYAEERIVRTLGRESTSPTEADLETLVSFLHQMAGGARFDWLSWHRSAANRTALLEQYELAQSVKDEPEPDESLRAVNVMTMIKRFDARFLQFARSVGETKCSGAVVRATYAMLSDHCHPASAAYMLYLNPTAVPHGHLFTSDPTDENLRRFFREMMGYVAPIGNIADRALIAIGKAENRFAVQAGRLPSTLCDWTVEDN